MIQHLRPPSIQKVLDDHKEWLDSNGERGVQLDLTGANLTKAIFREAILDESDMMGCSVRNAKMRAIDVRGSDLAYLRANSKTGLLHADIVRGHSDPPGSKAALRTKEFREASDMLDKFRRGEDPYSKGRGR